VSAAIAAVLLLESSIQLPHCDLRMGRDELADDLESVSSAFHAVRQQVQKAAPGALKGAVTGFMMGGPAGALAGAAASGLASTTSTKNGVANPAALELLMTLLRPEVVDALIAMVQGRQGARSVPVAGKPVPVAAVTNLIQSLAEHASATHHALWPRGGTPGYLGEALQRGEDIASSHVRANALLALVHEAYEEDSDD
jgi:hypothetical protein